MHIIFIRHHTHLCNVNIFQIQLQTEVIADDKNKRKTEKTKQISSSDFAAASCSTSFKKLKLSATDFTLQATFLHVELIYFWIKFLNKCAKIASQRLEIHIHENTFLKEPPPYLQQ